MNICKTCLSRFGCHPSFETDGVEICSFYEADKNAVSKQQRRYEIAKDTLAVLLTKPHALCDNLYEEEVSRAFNSLIKQLKK